MPDQPVNKSWKDRVDAVCLLSAVCCLQPSVCYLLSAACCLLSAICCLLSAVCCLLSAICRFEIKENYLLATKWLSEWVSDWVTEPVLEKLSHLKGAKNALWLDIYGRNNRSFNKNWKTIFNSNPSNAWIWLWRHYFAVFVPFSEWFTLGVPLNNIFIIA